MVVSYNAFFFAHNIALLAGHMLINEEAWLNRHHVIDTKEGNSKYNPASFTTRPHLEPGAKFSLQEIEPQGSI